MSSENIVELREAGKIYGGKRKIVALEDVSLVVRRGEVFGFLGPNGAGKSTTVNICTTRVLPTSGRVSLCGIDVVREPALSRRHMGVVPQYRTLDRSCTVWENLYFHCRYYGFNHSSARQRADELIQQFGLSARPKSFPGELSGGLMQRLEIARAISHRPEVLFLDEPTSSLDPQTRLALWEAIEGLHKEGVTVVLTTHNMEEADYLCDRIAIIDRGRIAACDTPKQLKSHVLGETIFDLRLKQSLPGLSAKLSSLKGVSAVEHTESGFRVYGNSHNGLLPQMVAVIGAKDLRDISLIEPSLESVFIRLTGRELRD